MNECLGAHCQAQHLTNDVICDLLACDFEDVLYIQVIGCLQITSCIIQYIHRSKTAICLSFAQRSGDEILCISTKVASRSHCSQQGCVAPQAELHALPKALQAGHTRIVPKSSGCGHSTNSLSKSKISCFVLCALPSVSLTASTWNLHHSRILLRMAALTVGRGMTSAGSPSEGAQTLQLQDNSCGNTQ